VGENVCFNRFMGLSIGTLSLWESDAAGAFYWTCKGRAAIVAFFSLLILQWQSLLSPLLLLLVDPLQRSKLLLVCEWKSTLNIPRSPSWNRWCPPTKLWSLPLSLMRSLIPPKRLRGCSMLVWSVLKCPRMEILRSVVGDKVVGKD